MHLRATKSPHLATSPHLNSQNQHPTATALPSPYRPSSHVRLLRVTFNSYNATYPPTAKNFFSRARGAPCLFSPNTVEDELYHVWQWPSSSSRWIQLNENILHWKSIEQKIRMPRCHFRPEKFKRSCMRNIGLDDDDVVIRSGDPVMLKKALMFTTIVHVPVKFLWVKGIGRMGGGDQNIEDWRTIAMPWVQWARGEYELAFHAYCVAD